MRRGGWHGRGTARGVLGGHARKQSVRNHMPVFDALLLERRPNNLSEPTVPDILEFEEWSLVLGVITYPFLRHTYTHLTPQPPVFAREGRPFSVFRVRVQPLQLPGDIEVGEVCCNEVRLLHDLGQAVDLLVRLQVDAVVLPIEHLEGGDIRKWGVRRAFLLLASGATTADTIAAACLTYFECDGIAVQLERLVFFVRIPGRLDRENAVHPPCIRRRPELR